MCDVMLRCIKYVSVHYIGLCMCLFHLIYKSCVDSTPYIISRHDCNERKQANRMKISKMCGLGKRWLLFAL